MQQMQVQSTTLDPEVTSHVSSSLTSAVILYGMHAVNVLQPAKQENAGDHLTFCS
jgi:hypothetical protein